MGPAGRKGQFKTRAGARLPAVRPTGPRRRTHSPQTKDPQVGGRGGGRGAPQRQAGGASSLRCTRPFSRVLRVVSKQNRGGAGAQRLEGGGRRFLRERVSPHPRTPSARWAPSTAARPAAASVRADAGRAAGWEPAGLGDGSPVPGSDLEGRGGPARVHLRPGHPPASQSALGRHDARERVPPSSAHVLRGPHATARRSESEHSPHGFPPRGASPAHSPETSLQRRHDCFPSQHYFTI